jgi:hypothetical protein
MEIAMSALFDQYPMLIFALEALAALALLAIIVVWTMSGRKTDARGTESTGNRGSAGKLRGNAQRGACKPP